MSLGVVEEEKFLVLSVGLNPSLKGSVLHQLHVSLHLVILGLIFEEKLLEVGVVEDVRVHAPASVSSLLLITVEAKGERAHDGNELFGAEVTLGQALNDETASGGLSGMLDGVTLVSDVLSAHVEDHGGASAILNSSVATELDEVSVAHHSSDVVAFSLDLLDLLDAEGELGALSNGELVLQGKST